MCCSKMTFHTRQASKSAWLLCRHSLYRGHRWRDNTGQCDTDAFASNDRPDRLCGVKEGNGSEENELNCVGHSFQVKHGAHRISIHPDSAASDKELAKRCSVYVD